MTATLSLSPRRFSAFPSRNMVLVAVLILLGASLLAWQAIRAQVDGDRGIIPIAASGDIQIGGIEVNVTGDNPEDAREKGWQLAQREAWAKLGGPSLPDSRIDSMVSAVIIEKEQIGPRRYVATLGVIFDKTRAGQMLGASGPRARSAPMLTLPVLIEGGTATMFERRNEWQRAWAEYQAGASVIDYVRAAGSGGESLLLTYGQTQRRSRIWWRNILNGFDAADVIIPIARVERQWPGGPVEAEFTARYGPDNKVLDRFRLKAPNDDAIPAMFDQAVKRMDGIFAQAVRDGKLKPDPTLNRQRLDISPAIEALIEAGRRAQQADRAAARSERSAGNDNSSASSGSTDTPSTTPTATPEPTVVNSYAVQFATPDPAALDSGLGSVRGTPGVRGVAISSTALGGVSVMRVTYAGDLQALAAALRGRGWNVTVGSGALSISR